MDNERFKSYDRRLDWVLDSSDDLEAMVKERDRRQASLGEGNKATGEHYGMIDQQTGREVDCLVKDRVSELLKTAIYQNFDESRSD